jgi:hypothetical protein
MPKVSIFMKNMFVGAVMACFGVCAASAQDPTSEQDAEPAIPPGVTKIDVFHFQEVSGVAATYDKLIGVGDNNGKEYLDIKADIRKTFSPTFGNGPICDAEDIEIGVKPDNTETMFVLSEDHATIFVEGGHEIKLPAEFTEECGRGSEGLSVKWSQGGWDLLVLTEGGVPEDKHAPNKAKLLQPNAKDCIKPEEIRCSRDKITYNALLARFRVEADGQKHELRKVVQIPISNLLETIDPTQGFRAADLTWYHGNILVLLGSTPKDDPEAPPFSHHWIKGFDLEGRPIADMTMKLEKIRIWDKYRKNKSWEGLDTLPDGRLVLSYDEKGNSEIVIFPPSFPIELQ